MMTFGFGRSPAKQSANPELLGRALTLWVDHAPFGKSQRGRAPPTRILAAGLIAPDSWREIPFSPPNSRKPLTLENSLSPCRRESGPPQGSIRYVNSIGLKPRHASTTCSKSIATSASAPALRKTSTSPGRPHVRWGDYWDLRQALPF